MATLTFIHTVKVGIFFNKTICKRQVFLMKSIMSFKPFISRISFLLLFRCLNKLLRLNSKVVTTIKSKNKKKKKEVKLL